MDNIISIGNVIRVTLTSAPVGLGTPNVNNVALFTTESPSNSDTFRSYVDPTTIGMDYGTSSVTAKMASNIFAQTPNLNSGNGRLIVIPMLSAVSATRGDLTTADITANLAGFQAVTDGEFEITIDGNAEDITGLDFSEAGTLADVAAIIQKKIGNATVVEVSAGLIRFRSKTVGASSAIAIASVSGGSGTDISGASYLNAVAATITPGVDSSGETLVDAITRVEQEANFSGVLTNLEMEDAVITTTASAVQAKDLIFVHHFVSTASITGICKNIKDASQTKTRCVLYTVDLEEANLMKSAYVGRGFSTNFNLVNGVQTMNLKSLANVTPDGGLNQTQYDSAKENGVDIFVSYSGFPAVLSSGGNKFFDQVYNQLQYKLELEVAGFNYLATTSTRIPQTEVGMDGLKAAYNRINEKFVTNGYIGEGLVWNSADTFGDPEDFKRNITDNGYYTFSLPIAQQAQADRDARIAPVVQIAVKEAGAIHESDVFVIVEA